MVFVSVKDAKPKRKVAVPIPENGSWEQFIGQVQTKLKVASVGQVYLATTGERILRLDQLQDIDELIVVEVKEELYSFISCHCHKNLMILVIICAL